MKLKDFTRILQQPERISKEHLGSISKVITTYPYFQPARALYLKGLKKSESFKYNQELKITAAYTTDRSILFDYITSKTFNQNDVSLQIKQNSEHLKDIIVNDLDDISINKSVAIDYALKQQIKDTEGVLDPNLFEKKINSDTILNLDVNNITESIEDKLNPKKPFEFNASETHSFSEWLKITNFKPIQREETPKAVSPIDNKLELIDKFLTTNPKIKPVKKQNSKLETYTSKHTTIISEGLMTETLARIYLEQKNYDKAIQSYKILSLKYPEKSGFFADQIKAVKELQDKII